MTKFVASGQIVNLYMYPPVRKRSVERNPPPACKILEQIETWPGSQIARTVSHDPKYISLLGFQSVFPILCDFLRIHRLRCSICVRQVSRVELRGRQQSNPARHRPARGPRPVRLLAGVPRTE